MFSKQNVVRTFSQVTAMASPQMYTWTIHENIKTILCLRCTQIVTTGWFLGRQLIFMGLSRQKWGLGGAWPIILLGSIVNGQCSVPQEIHCSEHEQILDSSERSLGAFTKSCISSWYMSLSLSCCRLDQIITLTTKLAQVKNTEMDRVAQMAQKLCWRRTSPVPKSVPKY